MGHPCMVQDFRQTALRPGSANKTVVKYKKVRKTAPRSEQSSGFERLPDSFIFMQAAGEQNKHKRCKTNVKNMK